MPTEINQTYANLVESVITYLDAIYDTIVGVIGATNAVPITINNKIVSPEHRDDTSIPVSEYSGLISKLSYIPNKYGPVNHYSSGTAVGHITYDVNISINGALNNAGYYDGSSTISLSGITAISPTLSGTPAIGAATGYTLALETINSAQFYTFSMANDYIAPKFSVAKGSLGITVGSVTVEANENNASALDLAFSNNSTLNGISFGTTAGSGNAAYHVTIGATPTISQNLSITPTYAITPGYISEGTVVDGDYTLSLSSSTLGERNYYIDITKGSLSNLTVSGTVATTNTSSIQLLTDQQASALSLNSDFFDIAVSPSVTFDTSNSSFTPGYISDAAEIMFETGQTNDVTLHITSSALSYDTTQKITLTTGSATNEVSGHIIPVSISGAGNSISVVTSEGYTKGGTTSLTINADTLNVTIPYGQAKWNNSTTATISVSDAGSILSPSGYYALNISSSGSATAASGNTSGYVRLGTDSNSTAPSVSGETTVYIAKGSASASIGTITSAYVDADGNVANNGVNDIFVAQGDLVQNKDYYTVTIPVSLTASEGYIKSNEFQTGSSVTKYIPKATFEYVSDDTNDGPETFLRVKTAGYIPSGIIGTIAEIGNVNGIDYATIAASLTGTGLVSTDNYVYNNTTVNNIPLTLSKGTVDAGYFEGAENHGTLTLSGNNYIKKAYLTLENTGSDITLDPSEFTISSGSYVFSDTTTVTTSIDGSIGYVTSISEDIHGTRTKDIAASLTLPEAAVQLSNSDNAIEVAIDTTNSDIDPVSYSTSHYTISLGIAPGDDNHITVETETAGYLPAGYTEQITPVITNDSASIYIKKGTPLTNISGTDNLLNKNITNPAYNSTTGKYESELETYNIPVTGTLEEGYYKDNTTNGERHVSGNATVTAKKLEMNVADVTVGTLAYTAGVTSAGVTLYASQGAGTYAAITPNATIAFTAPSISEGYIKSGDTNHININAGSATATTKYIELFRYSASAGENLSENYDLNLANGITESDVYNVITVGGQNVSSGQVTANYVARNISQADETYNDKPILVKLHEDAMGTEVSAQILSLERRLNGER